MINRMYMHWRRCLLGIVTLSMSLLSGCGSSQPLHIGAMFPLAGATAPLAQDEYLGLTIARDLANADGGVQGHQLVLDTQEVHDTNSIPAAIQHFHDAGTQVVIGTYSS